MLISVFFVCPFHESKLTSLSLAFHIEIDISCSRPSFENLKSALAQEYSLPPKEVSVEKSATSTVAEVVPQKDTETSPADETAVAVEEKSETPEVKEPEAEETVPAAEESDEAPEETEEKPEIVV